MAVSQNYSFARCQGAARVKHHVHRMRFSLTNENETVSQPSKRRRSAAGPVRIGVSATTEAVIANAKTSSLMSAKGMGCSNMVRARTLGPTMVGVVVLVWALCWVSAASSSHGADLNSDLVETETGWKFDDDDLIYPFDSPAASPALAPAAKPKAGVIPLVNGDFELCNVTGNTTIAADPTSTAIINWTPSGAGVQILFAATYGAPPDTPTSKLCIHLNTPTATNGTQGSMSTTLAANPATGKTYTLQYDVCRAPNGPNNLWSALKVSVLMGNTVGGWSIHMPVYNSSDTLGYSTWTKQSFVYVGTSASTVIKIESMSEKYGPIIDNVEILTGSHPLAAAPLGKTAGLCQRALPALSLLALSHLL